MSHLDINKDFRIIKIDDGLYFSIAKRILIKTTALGETMLSKEENYKCFENVLKEFDDENIIDSFPKTLKRHFLAREVFLLISDACNSRCLYCYSDAQKFGKMMSWDVAKASIDYCIRNALINKMSSGKSQIGFRFMGGGEPTLNIALMKKTTAYATEQCDKYGLFKNCSLQTNAQIESEQDHIWIANNMHDITVSMDGVSEIQNYQRPRVDNKDSFQMAEKFIDNVTKTKPVISLIRATITKNSMNNMKSFIDWLSTKSIKRLHVEPMGYSGRASDDIDGIQSPDCLEFVDNYIEWQKYAMKYDIKVVSSTDIYGRGAGGLCEGFKGNSLFINPHGNISCCTEITHDEDLNNSAYKIGSFNKSRNEFIFDSSNRDFPLIAFDKCNNCYANGRCFGCYVKQEKQDEYFCSIKSKMLLKKILSDANNNLKKDNDPRFEYIVKI